MTSANATSWQPAQPWNSLPLLPPSCDLESKAVLKKCLTARVELAELKQAAQVLPNQAMLLNILPLLEAKDSTEIENIVTTTDKLFEYADTSEHLADPATKEALRYRMALANGFQSLTRRPLTVATALAVCTTIMGAEMSIRKVPGTKIGNPLTGETIYTPPEGEQRLLGLLSNWERFLHEETNLDPLIRMAVGHYQFEAIHPFTDGNGRTGRVINSLYLVDQQLLTLPILYMSRYIVGNKSLYYRLLLDVTRSNAWEPWIIFMLDAVEQTARWTVDKINAIRELERATTLYVRNQAPNVYSRELIDIVFTQPYCRISHIVDQHNTHRQSASKYLKELCRIGILQEVLRGRDKVFIHGNLMRLLADETNTVRVGDIL